MPVVLSIPASPSLNLPNRSIRVSLRYGNSSAYLRQLLDVSAISIANNDFVYYSTVAEKFVVGQVPVIDGGTF